jgi:hypothetical protein
MPLASLLCANFMTDKGVERVRHAVQDRNRRVRRGARGECSCGGPRSCQNGHLIVCQSDPLSAISVFEPQARGASPASGHQTFAAPPIGPTVMRDANGQALAYVHSRATKSEATRAKVLTADKARRASHQSASCSENSAIRPEVSGQTLNDASAPQPVME